MQTHQGLTNLTLSNTSADRIYQIRARLITSLGETGWSDPATVPAAAAKATAPGAPSVSLSSFSTGNQLSPEYSVTVNWGAPNNGGRAIDTYRVRLVWNAGVTRSTSATVSRNSRSYNARLQVPAGTSVTAYVSANNGIGQGAWGSATRTL